MHLTVYTDVFSPVTPENQVTAPWDEIADCLCYFASVDEKEQASLFNLWQLKTVEQGAEPGGRHPYDPKTGAQDLDRWVEFPGTVRRIKRNAIGLHGLVLDYDANKSIEQVEKMLQEYEYVIYTTWNHSEVKDKFRVVMPFDRMMTKDEFELKLDAITQMFPGVDRASFSVTQAIYFHSGKHPELAYSRRNHGKILCVDSFANAQPKPVYVPPPTAQSTNSDPDAFSDEYRIAALKSLSTCSGVRRGGSDSLIIASAMKGFGCSYTEFQQMLEIIAGHDSSLRSEKVQSAVWQSAFNSHIKKVTLNEIIKRNHGQSIPKTISIGRPATLAELQKLRAKPMDKALTQSRAKELLDLIRIRNNTK